jgi:hypothetical protein
MKPVEKGTDMSVNLQPSSDVQQAIQAFLNGDILNGEDVPPDQNGAVTTQSRDANPQASALVSDNNAIKPARTDTSPTETNAGSVDTGAYSELMLVAARNEGEVRNASQNQIALKGTTTITSASDTPKEMPGTPSQRKKDSSLEGTDTVPTSERNTAALNVVKDSSYHIKEAAKRYNVSPELVASILFEENRRYDTQDAKDDKEAQENINAKREGNWDKSLGRAQMQVKGVEELLRKDYLDPKASYFPGSVIDRASVPTKEAYEKMNNQQRYEVCTKLLLNDKAAPYLIAAKSEFNAKQYANNGGDKRVLNPVSGSTSEVRDSVQFRVLTQLYSTPVPSKPNETYSLDSKVNYRGLDAYYNLDTVRDALNNGRITPFENWHAG